MRKVLVVLGFMVWCGTVTAQTTPIKMGLWDVTIRREARSSPAVAAAIRERGLSVNSPYASGFSGQTVDPPIKERWQKCIVESVWRKGITAIATVPKHCVSTHPFSNDAHGASMGVRCEGAGMSVVIEGKLSWLNREKMHLQTSNVIAFHGVEGESVATLEITSLFLKTDCGSVAPGASVPAK